MKNVLLITSSPRGEASHSSRVATDFAHQVGGNLVVRELWREPLPLIDQKFVHAMFVPETDRTTEQREILALSDLLINEIKAADVVVVAAGMINFGMPASLKAWIDLITRKGVTFDYGEGGAVGLLPSGKRLVLVLASGAVYSSGPFAEYDHLEPSLRTNLGFIGLKDIETIWIEGTTMGQEKALADATERVEKVLALVG